MPPGGLGPLVRSAARRVLPRRLREPLSRWLHRLAGAAGGPREVRVRAVLAGEPPPALSAGWREPEIAARQHEAFAPLLERLRAGRPREDFLAVAQAVRRTGLTDPSILEVGCGSGWNSEVLERLLGRPVRYVGMDYSRAMVALGRRHYPQARFVVGDAVALPFRAGACDILLSGTVLMHVVGYGRAIRESRRVTRRWCVFHTVPMLARRPTTMLEKLAYGIPVVEVVFQREAFLGLVEAAGFRVRESFDSVPHDYLSEALGERVVARTLLCEAG